MVRSPTAATQPHPWASQTQISFSSTHAPPATATSSTLPRATTSRFVRSADENRLPKVMEQDELPVNGVERSSSGSDEELLAASYGFPSGTAYDDTDGSVTYTPQSSISPYTPVSGYTPALSSWSSYGARPRGSSISNAANGMERAFTTESILPVDQRTSRPGAPFRTPSNTYAPARRPPQVLSINPKRLHSSRTSRRAPKAQYKAKEKAYVQRLKRGT